ncbi:RNA polymerase sigma factor [Sphingomonas aestuarii]
MVGGRPATSGSGLESIFLEHRDRLLRFLRARGAGDDAEDVLHDVWQRIANAPDGPIAEPLSYLFRACENAMRDRHRAAHARVNRETNWADSGHAPEPPPGGERVLIARERLAQVNATLAALPPAPRVETIFRRFRLEGMGQAEIARDLGVSLSTVEKDLQKAYRALAELQERFDAE